MSFDTSKLTALAHLASIAMQVIHAVYQAEIQFPAPKSGQSKLAWVQDRAIAVIDGSPLSDDEKAAFKEKAVVLIEAAVTLMHVLNAFHSATSAPTPPDAPKVS